MIIKIRYGGVGVCDATSGVNSPYARQFLKNSGHVDCVLSLG